jgi:quaternary ammonium compound-resistance protein SugE
MKDTPTYAWLILVLAGFFESAWAIGMKYTEGFTKLLPSIATIILIIISMGLLAWAIKYLPVGSAYAVWTGIGAIGAVVAGIVLFHEPAGLLRLFFVFLIISGILGLYLIRNNA